MFTFPVTIGRLTGRVRVPQRVIVVLFQDSFTLIAEGDASFIFGEQIGGTGLVIDSPRSLVTTVQRPRTIPGPFLFQITANNNPQLTATVEVQTQPVSYTFMGWRYLEGQTSITPSLAGVNVYVLPRFKTGIARATAGTTVLMRWTSPLQNAAFITKYIWERYDPQTLSYIAIESYLPTVSLIRNAYTHNTGRIRVKFYKFGRALEAVTSDFPFGVADAFYGDETASLGFGFVRGNQSFSRNDYKVTFVPTQISQSRLGFTFIKGTQGFSRNDYKVTFVPTQISQSRLGFTFINGAQSFVRRSLVGVST